jgi:hypothetical protein
LRTLRLALVSAALTALAAAAPASGAVSFAEGKSFPSTEAHNGVAAADFDGDGDRDLAYIAAPTGSDLRSDGFIGVRENDGKGGFGAETRYPADDGPTGLVAADMNGDGRPDLVVTARELTSDTVSVHLNAAGGFPDKASYRSVGGPNAVDVADMDGDGDLDVVVGGFADPERGPGRPATAAGVHLNGGDGTLGPVSIYQAREEGEPFDVAVGDFNGDGIRDVALADFNFGLKGQVSVFPGTGAGGVLGAPATYETAGAASDLSVGKLNGDGADDLVVGSPDQPEVLLSSAGGFAPPRVYDTETSSIGEVFVADFDRDRVLDIAAPGAGGLRFLVGKGGGTFALDKASVGPGGGRSVTAADLNGDGSPDLAIAGFGVDVYLNRSGASKPRLRLSGIPRGCAPRSFRLRVRASGSVRRVEVRVDGKRVKRTARRSFVVRVKAARRGKHRIAVTATGAGGRAVKRASFRRC